MGRELHLPRWVGGRTGPSAASDADAQLTLCEGQSHLLPNPFPRYASVNTAHQAPEQEPLSLGEPQVNTQSPKCHDTANSI